MIVFRDHNQRQTLDRGKVHSFIERSGAGAAVADVSEPNNVFLLQASAQENSRHHRNHVAEMRDGPEKTFVQITKVNVEIFAAGRSPGLRHVLRKNLAGTNAFDEHRAEIANDRSDEVFRTKRVS